jgi:anti-sigma B factor antagonist
VIFDFRGIEDCHKACAPLRPAAGTARMGGADGDDVGIQIETRADADAVCVALGGDVDLTEVDRLDTALRGALDLAGDGGPGRVVVDLGKVDFLDSSGINALVAAYRHAREESVALTIDNTPDAVRQLLELVGVYQTLVGAT